MNKDMKILMFFCILSAIVVIIYFVLLFKVIKLPFFTEISIIQPNKIAVVSLNGEIFYSSGNTWFSYGISAKDVVRLLDKLDNDPSVKVVIIDLNSPGGSFIGSKVIAEKIHHMKKPVIIVCEEICASGGYLIAAAGDKIFVDNSTITGSIGVIISYLDLSKFIKNKNITYVVFKSGKYKDMGTPYRNLTKEEKEIFKNIVATAYKELIGLISKYRGINLEKLPDKVKEASILTGEEAVKYGLADKIGSLEDAIHYAQEKYCNNHCEVEYIQQDHLSSLF